MAIELTQLQIYIIIGYMALINLIAIVMFGIDKSKARQGNSRLSEKSLFFISFIGGIWGGILGMMAFRHKTRKMSFKAVMFIILLINLAGYYYLIVNSNLLDGIKDLFL
jgi:uncharacterized membrane protein YsdA (DUF1294 family)